ncbi:MAG: DNA repair protein RecN [Actinomycetota bacterium]
MLRELHISGLGVIDDLDLSLDPGLNVLTGETGAGKTMITVGLALALGARASTSMLREGSGAARVQALFDPREGAEEWIEDDALLLSRSVSSEGRGTCRVGGQLATASALATLGTSLVEVHGQHQAQRLLEPAVQTAFLDRFAGEEHLADVAAYRAVYDELRRARAALDDLRVATRERERELDLLTYQTSEIEALMPGPGESDELMAEEARLGHVERLLEAGGVAEAALSGDRGAADDALGVAAGALDEAVALDPGAGAIAERAAALAAEAAELARDVRVYRESLAPDPERLQMVRERMVALKGLQRKYGETDGDVLAYLAEASSRLRELQGADERLSRVTDDVEALTERADDLAGTIGEVRRATAERLATAIERELEELGMPGAAVDVALEPLELLGPGGGERVELRFAGTSGRPSAPLAKTASGGELSRTMLACRSVMADLDDVPTLVFDEVDAGIGGRAGLAVGRRLARLARDRQVLVVSHLPQIACFADRHVRVTKHDGTAAIEVLDDAARVAELSRMLAGLERSASAVSHAEELLDEASRVKAGA